MDDRDVVEMLNLLNCSPVNQFFSDSAVFLEITWGLGA